MNFRLTIILSLLVFNNIESFSAGIDDDQYKPPTQRVISTTYPRESFNVAETDENLKSENEISKKGILNRCWKEIGAGGRYEDFVNTAIAGGLAGAGFSRMLDSFDPNSFTYLRLCYNIGILAGISCNLLIPKISKTMILSFCSIAISAFLAEAFHNGWNYPYLEHENG